MIDNTKLAELSPREFENLIFDYIVSLGFKNVTWRTPGADGGRDIEASSYIISVVGTVLTEKWYIECKKFSISINWPTVYEKISYAESNGADVLCIASYPNPSPNCETEISKWNSQRKSPRIETLRAYDLDFSSGLRRYIGVKYKLIAADAAQFGFPLLELVATLASQAYSASAAGIDNHKYIELASAVADLAEVTSRVLYEGEGFVPPSFEKNIDGYDWVEGADSIQLPAALLRAVFCLAHLSTSTVRVMLSPNSVSIPMSGFKPSTVGMHTKFVSAAAILDCELRFSGDEISIVARET